MYILYGLCVALHIHAAFTFKNNWDSPVNFHCPSPTQAIDAVVSFHSNYYEDRRYELHCGKAMKSGKGVSCHWSGYVNDYDQAVHFRCPGAGYINGMASYHHNHYEDRRHKFRCCGRRGSNYHYKKCYWTNWLNGFDQPVVYFVPKGYVLRGVNSFHHNYYEDRRFKFEVCKLK